jgi:lipopolysaccharide transport system permease protein
MTILDRVRPADLPSEPGGSPEHQKVRVVTAEDGIPGLGGALAELWRYRELLISMALRELRVRYRQSTLGPAWAVLQPLALVVVFSLFLGRFAHMPSYGIPYPIFYFAALAPWSFAAGAVPAAASSLVFNSSLIRKVYFPREVFPIVAVIVAAADLGFSSIGLAGMMVWFHTPLTASMLYLPVLLLGQFLLCLACGLLLAGVTVYLRDIRHGLPVVMQIWMYASPVVYSLELVPRRFLFLYMLLNPLAAFMDGYRRVLLQGRPPQFGFLGLSIALSAVIFVLAYRLFKTLERRCADTI